MPVRAWIRREDDRAAEVRALGAEIVTGDLTRPETVAAALDGARRPRAPLTHTSAAARSSKSIGGSAERVFTPSGNIEHQDALPPVQRPGPGRGEHLRKEATDG